MRNAVTECALEFDKHVHVDQNHCWTYHRMESATDPGRTFQTKPKATDLKSRTRRWRATRIGSSTVENIDGAYNSPAVDRPFATLLAR